MQRDSNFRDTVAESDSARSYSPTPAASPRSVILPVSGTTLEIAREGADGGEAQVCLRFGGSSALAVIARHEDVTRWCAETSVLLEVTLVVTHGDELQIRTPMLVGEDGRCLGVIRRVTETGSEFTFAIAASPTEMLRSAHELVLRVTRDELQHAIDALRGEGAAGQVP